MIDNSITQNKESQDKMTPELAIELLKRGNDRFLMSEKLNRNYKIQIRDTAKNQHPFAIILSCIDSRVSTEIIFDQGIGDIFNVCLPANMVNIDVLGSIEYACKIIGVKLIVVLGHTSCGAIQGAYNNLDLDNLNPVLKKLQKIINKNSDKNSEDEQAFLNTIALLNVQASIDEIQSKSTIIKQLVNDKAVEIIGGMYDVETGKVLF